MKYPDFLKPNGTIGFVAPSFGCVTEPYRTAFYNALNKFKEMGYKTLIGPNCYKADGIGISSSPENCGNEINDMFCSDKCDIIISCGGGELMCEDLEYINFDALCSINPKWYLGYSDNTNLIFPLTTMCDTASIYSACAPAYGMEPWHKCLEDTFELLTGCRTKFKGYDKWELESLKTEESPLEPYNTTEDKILKVWNPRLSYLNIKEGSECKAYVSGRLVGGCIDCLDSLVGTRFDTVGDFQKKYKDNGFIWFLEACDLNVMALRRSIWHMEMAGWFNYCNGFIIGRPRIFNEPVMGLDQYEAILGVLRRHNVPVIMDADLGHLPPAIPIVSGALADIDVNGNELTINYSFS